MEVTTDAEGEMAVSDLAQRRQHVGEVFAIVLKLSVAVRRSHDVRNAIQGCHATHLGRYLPRLGAVIDSGKNVAVNIDHLVSPVPKAKAATDFTDEHGSG